MRTNADPDLQNQLHELMARRGVTAASQHLGLSRRALLRLASGARVNNGSIAQAQQRLGVLHPGGNCRR